MDFNSTKHCLNCNETLHTPYCGHCGQKKATRISFAQLFHTVQKGLLEFRSPLVTTLVNLTVKPTQVYLDYIDGKRIRYFNPFKYSFWLLTLMIIVSTLTNTPIFNLEVINPEIVTTHPEILKTQPIIDGSIIYGYFFASMLTATIYRLFFYNERFLFSELCIASTLNYCHFSLVYTALLLTGIYQEPMSMIGSSIVFMVYQTWSIGAMFKAHPLVRYFKALIATIISFFLYSMAYMFLIGALVGYSETSKELDSQPTLNEQIIQQPAEKLPLEENSKKKSNQ